MLTEICLSLNLPCLSDFEVSQIFMQNAFDFNFIEEYFEIENKSNALIYYLILEAQKSQQTGLPKFIFRKNLKSPLQEESYDFFEALGIEPFSHDQQNLFADML